MNVDNFFIDFQTISSPLTMDKINICIDNFLQSIKSFIREKRVKNVDWSNEHIMENPPKNNEILDKCHNVLRAFEGFIIQKFRIRYPVMLESLSIELRKLHKDKNLDWYEELMDKMKLTNEEMRLIHDEPENYWKLQNDNKFTAKYNTTTKMNCPECNAEVFINSYLKTHKGSKKCTNALLPKPPKKNALDKIKCCELCSKEEYYSNSSRMKMHRSKCEIYQHYTISCIYSDLQKIEN